MAAAYALGGKMLPELSIGPIDLDQASQFARLRAPLGYWNALGMLMVMATPACIAFAAAREGAPGARIVALLALELLLVTLALTYSRGALLALAVAVVVIVAAGPDRLRRLGVAALAVLASVPPVAFAFGSDKLSHDGVAAAERATEGLELLAIFAGSMLALAAVAVFALRAESGRSWSNARKRGVWRLIALFAAIAALTGIAALASSDRGLTGTVSHEWKEFREPVGISNEPVRLISSNGSNRWIWWREAAGAFSDRPLAGWGAGSFPILHDRYREYRTQVRSAHSVPLQFLAEGGIVGAALAIGAIALLFAAAIRTALSSEGADRSARMTLIASASAWAVHCLVDWDWEIPALTLAALAALAVAAAPWGADRSWTYPSPPRSRSGRRLRVSPRRGPVAIPVALLAGFAAAAFALSAALPVAADSRRLDALREAADAGVSDAALEKAADDAAEAHDLNPLDADALLAQATIEHRLGNDADARDLLLEASRVQPDDYRVWEALFGFAQITGDTELAKLALERRAEAEPLSISDDPGPSSGLAYTLAVPPEQSPTAVGTPP